MKKSFVIFKYTFVEIVRSKLMVFIPLVSGIILFASYLSSTFAYGAPGKVAIDIGFGLMSITNLVIAIFAGANLVNKEIETKTVYMVISKPISRGSFLLGKTLGLSFVLFINVVVQTIVCSILYWNFNGSIPKLVYYVGLFSLFEAILLMLISICYSLFTTVPLSVIFSVVSWIVGNVLFETKKIIFLKDNHFLEKTLDVGAIFVPNFSQFNVKDFIIYQQDLPSDFILRSILYFIVYTCAIYLFAKLLFDRKDLN